MQRKRKRTPSEAEHSLSEKLQPQPTKYHDYEYPKVSVIIPAYNCAQNISLTVEGVLEQQYPDFEMIIVDAGSTDRTLEVVKGYRDDRILVYSVSGYHPYEMLNKGVSQSDGAYLNFLYPGDYYINTEVLTTMMTLALEEEKPQLVYCGTLLRYDRKEPQILFRSMTEGLLMRGQQPTSLQSCWIHQDAFKKLGKFDTSLELRGGYEFLCRFHGDRGMNFASLSRVLTDYDLRNLTKDLVVKHFIETFRVVYCYYGLRAVARWLFILKDFKRFFKLWSTRLKVALFGSSD